MIILVSVSAGTLLAGFLGAVIAVPIVAATIAFVQGLRKEFVVEEPPTISQQLPGLRTRARSVLHRRERTVPDEPDRLVGD
jgi:hypothetical protein